MERAVVTDGATIRYAVDGDPAAPPLLLINSIGSTREMWAPQTPVLSRTWRVITYDARGHGRSSVPPGEYTLEQLAHDALAVLDDAGAPRAHVCGISLGGLTAQWMALHAPGRVDRLILANTAARIGSVEFWTERIATVRHAGMAPLAELTMQRWFSAKFHERAPETVRMFRAMVEACPVDGYLGCCAALRDADLRERVSGITASTLLIASPGDVATPPAGLDFIRQRVRGAQWIAIESGHLSNVEGADAFTSAVSRFLAS